MARAAGQPMEAGGFMDQDWATTVQAMYLDRVYKVVDAWRHGKLVMGGADAQLILSLTQQGLMT